MKIFPKEINGYNSILSTSLFIAFILMRQNVDFQHGWIDCRKATFAAGRFVDYVDFPRAGRSGFYPARGKSAKLSLALCKDHLFYNHISELTFELNGTTEKMPSKD